MSLFWVGDGPPDALSTAFPQTLKRKLSSRRVPGRRKAVEAKPAVVGGTSCIERLPSGLASDLFSHDGYNLTRELLGLRVSRTLKDAVGEKPLFMVTATLPLLRQWRDAVFPPPPRSRTRVNSFTHSPVKRASRNREILFF